MNPAQLPVPSRPPPSPAAILARFRDLQSKPARTAQHAFVIEGLRPFIHAHDAGFHFEAVIESPILLKGDLPGMLARRLAAAGVPRMRVSPEQFRALSIGVRASGIAAILRQKWTPLQHLSPARGIGFLVLEFIRCPGNLGTILRTAEAAGASGVIFLSPPESPGVSAADPFHPACIRASMGGLFHVPLARASHAQLSRWIGRHNVDLVALSPDAPRAWTEMLPAPRPAALAIALGEERQGISPRLRGMCSTALRLPMTGRADSLNVAIAAGVMLYELVRQQQKA
jgi:TrmH family RNA methyltransferase